MNMNTAQEPEVVTCAACATIPVSYLSLDLPEPLVGWTASLDARGIEVESDDLGRPSIRRADLAELLGEQRRERARLAMQRAESAPRREAPVPAGVPAVDGATPYESLAAAGLITPNQEFGDGRRPAFEELLDGELAETRRQAAVARAEAEAVKRAQRVLDGRDA